MPNVGKSTLLNALRHIGISGRELLRPCTVVRAAPDFADYSDGESAANFSAARYDSHTLDAIEAIGTALDLCV
jgi:hypothetical protein